MNEDLLYLHQHAGKELESVKEAHDLVSNAISGSPAAGEWAPLLLSPAMQVAGYLNPLLGEQKEQEIAEQVDVLQATLQSAHQQVTRHSQICALDPVCGSAAAADTRPLQVHQSESLLEQSVTRLSALERSAAKFRFTAEGPQPQASTSRTSTSVSTSAASQRQQQQQLPPSPAQDQPRLQPAPVVQQQFQEPSQPPTQQQVQQAADGRTLCAGTDLPPNLQNFWFPAEFSSRLRPGQLVPLQLFEQPWVLFRDGQGSACCIRDTCAHRACPLSLGSVCKVRRVSCVQRELQAGAPAARRLKLADQHSQDHTSQEQRSEQTCTLQLSLCVLAG